MTELEKKESIKSFMKKTINEKKFKESEVCKDKKYKDVIKDSNDIINNLDKEDVEFHIMLCKFIKDKKMFLVDEENFDEYSLDTFIYKNNKLNLISL